MEELIPIALFMCVAAVMILRPITTRLGHLLETIAKERKTPPADDTDLAGVRMLVDHVSRRMDLVEERLDFTERLVAGSRRSTPGLTDHAARDRTSL